MQESDIKKIFTEDGFAIINDVFSANQVQEIVNTIDNVSSHNPSYRKSAGLFAIRRFLIEIPVMTELLFTCRLCETIRQLFGKDYFIVKSIYFDKPAASNWFVAWHQDSTIAVDRKADVEGFNNWTVKQNSFAVQPPLYLLENNFTLRIHLDDTDAANGALKVIPAFHVKGIARPETIDEKDTKETICEVDKGGIMLMRPLLFHASNKTVNNNQRRVIHIEFTNRLLPGPLQWAEYQEVSHPD